MQVVRGSTQAGIALSPSLAGEHIRATLSGVYASPSLLREIRASLEVAEKGLGALLLCASMNCA